MNIDLLLSIGGLLITVFGAIHYFSKVRNNQTPEVPVAFVTSLVVGSIMGIAAIFHISLSIPASTLVSLPIAILLSTPM